MHRKHQNTQNCQTLNTKGPSNGRSGFNQSNNEKKPVQENVSFSRLPSIHAIKSTAQLISAGTCWEVQQFMHSLAQRWASFMYEENILGQNNQTSFKKKVANLIHSECCTVYQVTPMHRAIMQSFNGVSPAFRVDAECTHWMMVKTPSFSSCRSMPVEPT